MAFFRFIYKSLILLRALIRHRYLFSENQSQKTKELCGLLYDLGPFYVKLGQILSTRPDLIGEDLAHILSDLQDRLPAFSGEVARAIIERELKQPLADIFPVFQKEAIAAASVAQVHLAEDAAGHKFAIKVLRPEIEKRFAEDVRFLRILSKIGLFIKPAFKRFKPLETLDLVRDMIRVETNLLMEASALSTNLPSIHTCADCAIALNLCCCGTERGPRLDDCESGGEFTKLRSCGAFFQPNRRLLLDLRRGGPTADPRIASPSIMRV